MLSFDNVVEKFCLCDVEMYLKVKDGVVVGPSYFAGMKVEEVLKKAKGVVVRTTQGGFEHVFVIKRSAYLKKTAPAALAAVTV
ncbi:hypothetical protein Pogu_1016 [Pyrobaculum oguniense TE7]|uniref:Uncharacterized protein n=1 Tax=Pyrobaculum oguniense (strain DSM 13380 / JCM 10595 / TE7) TaxID=698757 RepID=H6Q9Y5_PYROT|nr:hypothetical protein Pogu_1016 [Pyrobaculum oguniense TE7]